MRPPRAAVAVAAALAALSCSPHRVTESPAPPVAVPADYSGDAGAAPLPGRWWRDFGDRDLDRLVDQALGANLGLRAAWARVDQARAIGRQVASARWPQIEAALEASRQRFRSPFADVSGVGDAFPTTFTINRFAWSLSAGYELDLWGRVSSQARAAARDLEVVRADAEAMAMTLTAEIAEAYFDIVFQRQQRLLLEEQVVVNETFLELIRLRFQQGLATALDIYQQEQQLVATRSQLPLVDSAAVLLEHRLAVLLGRPPGQVGALGERAELPELPPIPGAGVPADLLDRRPDVRAARLAVEAADHRVAAAVADRLPGIRIGGSISGQSARVQDLVAAPLWSILGSIIAPLFDGGRRAAEVDRTRAVVEERLYGYGQVLLQAMVEVEGALVQERQYILYIADLESQVDLAGRAVEEARVRYREGLSDFLPVLTALQTQQRTELALLQARRQLVSIRIQLCRALGGTWTAGLVAPTHEAN